jgi:hypothetical protein
VRVEKVMRRYGALFLLAILSGAAYAQNALPVIKWRTALEGQQSRMAEFERHFMYSQGDLQTYWKKAFGDSPANANLRVDWNREMLIAVHLGRRNTGGFSVYVETIARTTAAAAVVSVVEKKPSKGQMVTMAQTSPFVIVAVERPGVVDWQFKRKEIENRPIVIGGGKCGCNCWCRTCHQDGVFFGGSYNPTPNGSWSIDNYEGVRQLGRVPFLTYRTGLDSRLTQPSLTIIQSERQFFDAWAEAFGRRNVPVESGIDWRREQIAALHVGQVQNGAYPTVELIQRLWDGSMEITYALNHPKMPRVQERTYPYIWIRMSRVTEPIKLKRIEVIGSAKCNCACRDCAG